MLKEIEAILRAFFWDGITLNKRKARVTWTKSCLPKDEVLAFIIIRRGTKQT